MIRPEDLAGLRGADVHVVGVAGSEGTAMARFLHRRGVGRLTLHDVGEGDALRTAFDRSHVGLPPAERAALWDELDAIPARRRFGADYLEGIEEADAIFAGQAWYLYPENERRIAPLIAEGRPLYGLMDLYFGLAPAPILAVTGSNGKSTTSRLVEHILQLDGRTVWYAGNERRSVQVLDALPEMRMDHWLVLEVSNRHLRSLELPAGAGPRIGVITNVLPNHLDEHGGSMDEYAAVKQKLVSSQGHDDWAVLNADNPVTRGMAAGDLPGRVRCFSRSEPQRFGAWTDGQRVVVRAERGGEPVTVGDLSEAKIPGSHNQENILAAALAARIAGARPDSIRKAIRSFRGLRHRIQFVWGSDGVEYYDDLNSTTPEATVAALRALAPTGSPGGPDGDIAGSDQRGAGRSIILIAGGGDKGLPMGELAEGIARHVRRLVLLPGEGSDRIEDAVRDISSEADVPLIDRFDEFGDAVHAVVDGARRGDRVLLSPACPYFFRRFYVDGPDELGFRALLREATTAESADARRSAVSRGSSP